MSSDGKKTFEPPVGEPDKAAAQTKRKQPVISEDSVLYALMSLAGMPLNGKRTICEVQ
jgi:hypothetical protein